jgi:hypothetical protein
MRQQAAEREKNQMSQQASLYDQDFYLWTQRTAEALRARRFEDIDIENAAEEIESLGRSDKRELRNRLISLTAHLLKWQFQPDLRGKSWEFTIGGQRDEIKDQLKESPSLKSVLDSELADAYPRGRKVAARETGYPIQDFPISCPWTIEQILDETFWPTDVY